MADFDGDDNYSDDDLDALRSEDLEELEQDAVRLTQHQPGLPSTALHVTYARHAAPGEAENALAHGQALEYPDQASSDYGDLDEEILDTGVSDIPQMPVLRRPANSPLRTQAGVSINQEQWKQQRFSTPIPPQLSQPFRVPQSVNAAANSVHRGVMPNNGHEYDGNVEMLDVPDLGTEHQPGEIRQNEEVEVLKAKVAELLKKQETLQQAVQSADEQILIKTGEVSIVRANQLKLAKEHEKKVAELKALHAEAIERQNIEIRNARAEKERALTDNAFSNHDHILESTRPKPIQKKNKAPTEDPTTLKLTLNQKNPVTPKKNRILPFGDGFEDDEITVISPSKLGRKSKAATPKAGTKRKRKAVEDSPSFQLDFCEPIGDVLPDAFAPENPPAPSAAEVAVVKEDHRYQFSQLVINHRPKHGGKRSLEVLAEFTFPSEPRVALSTLLLDKMALLAVKPNIDNFPAAMGSIVVSLWSKCVEQKYYRPLYLLIDLVKFILLSSSSATVSPLIDELVPLAQLTADINVIHRYVRFKTLTLTEEESKREASDDVDTTECLQVLYLIASICLPNPDDIVRFWRCIRFDFISMLLRNSQLIEDVHLMLKLLSTSIRDDSFAMIVGPGVSQPGSETHIIERVSSMLVEIPRAADGEQPYDAVEIAELRLEILSLIEKLCNNSRGGESFARHLLAIGRLVRLMNDELSAMYDGKYGWEHRAELVNRSTRLLFYLRSTYPNLINMQEKLRVHPGGAHKHLIALTRLTFSENLFYERGIEDDVVACAHQMLEDSVSPEEGDALFEAFSSSTK